MKGIKDLTPETSRSEVLVLGRKKDRCFFPLFFNLFFIIILLIIPEILMERMALRVVCIFKKKKKSE